MESDSTKISYPYMPEGRSILYVSENDPFIGEAKRFSIQNSTDKHHPTGAVVVKNKEILGFGANQSVFKNKYFLKKHGEGFCIRKFLKIKSGEKYWLCPGCVTNDGHAEANAVKMAVLKHGKEGVLGADLYLWGHWWCCKPCWDKMREAGIKNVYLLEKSEILFK